MQTVLSASDCVIIIVIIIWTKTLTVLFCFLTAIKILKKPKDVTSLLGATAVFEVGISEDNIPVQWMFNNQELRPSESYTMLSDKKNHRLMVQDVDHSKQGEYTALVGHLHCSAKLLVECECLRRPLSVRTCEKVRLPSIT